jgi:RimJ/RimL family protein N-acetyltransferase
MSLTLRPATLMDLPLLVQMNQHLIQDEGSSNPMNTEQLESRMRRWFNHWQIELFTLGTIIVGYTIYRLKKNESDGKETIYIRHYYIERDYRRQGFGKEGLQLLKKERFSNHTQIYLEVLWHNQRGRDFWNSLGFSPYSVTMKLE